MNKINDIANDIIQQADIGAIPNDTANSILDNLSKIEICHIDCLSYSTTKKIDMIYMDPPYGPTNEDDYYGVGSNLDQFIQYISDRLIHLKSFLNPIGHNVLVHVDWKCVHYLKVEMDKIFGRDNFRNEIIWGFSNPAASKRWLGRKHQTILWYGVGNYVFNQPRIPYTGKLNVGGKTGWSEKKDSSSYLANGKPLEDWWTDIPALCRNESEKTGYATQKPNKLLTRIIETFSEAGQTIIDPFMGSGTTLENGLKLGRNVIGCDISENACKIATERCVNGIK